MDLHAQAEAKSVSPAFEELRTLDAEFLHLEDAQSPMHIAALCIFEGPAVSKPELEQLIAAALDRVPRYRRRVQRLPLELGRPVWVDDPEFDVGRHVHQVQLPGAPQAGEAALCELMGSLLSRPLDRRRPLWDAWLVHGLADGRWGLVARVHHAMVDGISGIGLLRFLLDEAPCAARPEPVAWRAAPLPAASSLLSHAAHGLWRDIRGAGRALLRGLREPAQAVGATGAVAVGLVRFGVRLYSRRTSSLQGSIRGRRRYAFALASLAELKTIRRAFGCTINDVVLCLLSGGYRALLAAQGDDVERLHVRSLVPVSVRRQEASGAFDNRVSAVFCQLPVSVADPLQRLRAVRSQMAGLKDAHMVEAGVWFMHAGDFVPPLLVGAASRAAAHIMHQHPQRIVSTVTTNVPGPQLPLYLLGRKLVHWLPHVPITQGARVGSACLSYNGELAFGISADYSHIPDLAPFTAALASELAILLAHARARQQATAEEV